MPPLYCFSLSLRLFRLREISPPIFRFLSTGRLKTKRRARKYLATTTTTIAAAVDVGIAIPKEANHSKTNNCAPIAALSSNTNRANWRRPGRLDGKTTFESDAGLSVSFSHAARATGVAIMVSNSTGVKHPNAA